MSIPKDAAVAVVDVDKLKVVDEAQFNARYASGPVYVLFMHWDVMLWHVVCTPYVEAVKSALSGIVAVAGTMRPIWSSVNATELRMEALFNVRRPSGNDCL